MNIIRDQCQRETLMMLILSNQSSEELQGMEDKKDGNVHLENQEIKIHAIPSICVTLKDSSTFSVLQVFHCEMMELKLSLNLIHI